MHQLLSQLLQSSGEFSHSKLPLVEARATPSGSRGCRLPGAVGALHSGMEFASSINVQLSHRP